MAGAAPVTRLLLYNIRYGAGTGLAFNLPFPGAGYLRPTRRNTARLKEFIANVDADIQVLIEADLGSVRSGACQAEQLAQAARHEGLVRACKYAQHSPLRRAPLLRHQGNALSARRVRAQRVHYLSTGSKRLVLEATTDNCIVFAAHLAVTHHQRKTQLSELAELVRRAPLPTIVAGDLNLFRGVGELDAMLGTTGLRVANPAPIATYPTLAPRHQLDFVLVSPDIEVLTCRALTNPHSDHLPLLCEFAIAT